MRKLFLGGLSFSTTEDDIKEAFQHYGKIVDCVVIRDPTRRDDPTPSRSRGFGFVTFQTAQETQAVLDARKREKIKMNGREIDIKRAMAREVSQVSTCLLCMLVSLQYLHRTQPVFSDSPVCFMLAFISLCV